MSIVGMDWNAAEIPGLIDLCEKSGLLYAVDMKVTAGLDGDRAPCRLRATEQQLDAVLADPRVTSFEEGFGPRPFAEDQTVCGVGTRCPFIRPDGEVWPCVALPWSLGNVRDKPYRDILSDSERLKKAREITWGDSDKCRQCSVSWACARCPGDAFVENGDVNEPTPMECALARAKARLSGAVGNGRCGG